MNRISGRSWIVWLLVLALIGGMGFFVMEFSGNARQWVFFDERALQRAWKEQLFGRRV